MTGAAATTLRLSWERLHRDTQTLAWRVREAGPFQTLVSITRGGLVPAAILAQELNIRNIETIGMIAYGEDRIISGVQQVKPLAEAIRETRGQGVIVVDDLVDTGLTVKAVRDILPRAYVACVYAKPLGRPMVDSFAVEMPQDTWIEFPWDEDCA